jgi:predicted phosphate transport protein (TIGR00153 family)
MPFSILPKEYGFFDFFDQHAVKCLEGAKLLQDMIGNIAEAEFFAKRLKDVEHEGDEITHRTVETLHKTFITPLDREEIHQLISRMDDVLDLIDAGGQRVFLYGIKETTAEAKELAEVLVKATHQVKIAVTGLRTLKDPTNVLTACVEINRLENEADSVLRRAMARLFRESTDPIELIRWKDVYEFLEGSSDRCEDVANIVEGIVLEHA